MLAIGVGGRGPVVKEISGFGSPVCDAAWATYVWPGWRPVIAIRCSTPTASPAKLTGRDHPKPTTPGTALSVVNEITAENGPTSSTRKLLATTGTASCVGTGTGTPSSESAPSRSGG